MIGAIVGDRNDGRYDHEGARCASGNVVDQISERLGCICDLDIAVDIVGPDLQEYDVRMKGNESGGAGSGGGGGSPSGVSGPH